jgi:hypothetical protein
MKMQHGIRHPSAALATTAVSFLHIHLFLTLISYLYPFSYLPTMLCLLFMKGKSSIGIQLIISSQLSSQALFR